MVMFSPQEYARMPVRVTRDGAVYIGEERLPGCIAKRGVTIEPSGSENFTRMTVEFIVAGPVDVEEVLSEP
jgi:hypothetical protein